MGVKVPNGATTSHKVEKTSVRVCVAKGTSVVGRATGTCKFKVTVTKRTRTKRGVRTVANSFAVRISIKR